MFCLGCYGKTLIGTFQAKAPKAILSLKLSLLVLSTWRVGLLLPFPPLWSKGKLFYVTLLTLSHLPSCQETNHMISLLESRAMKPDH